MIAIRNEIEIGSAIGGGTLGSRLHAIMMDLHSLGAPILCALDGLAALGQQSWLEPKLSAERE